MRIIFLLLIMIESSLGAKFALVMGNSAYEKGRLPNPVNDARLIADDLKSLGFSVTMEKNIKTASKMKRVINSFASKLKSNDIAVVYYAGHGVQYKGKNYLMPTQANAIKGAQLESEAVNLDFLVGGVSEIKLAIVMLDACRKNTYPTYDRSQSRGLAQVKVPSDGGMIISYATAPNEVAADGSGNHSPYAKALSKYMGQKLPIETFFRKVGGEVYQNTGKQRPMLKNSFYGDFSFGQNVVREDVRPIEVKLIKKKNTAKKMYIKNCKLCHDSGAMGAPEVGSSTDWNYVMKKGFSKVLHNAIYGRNGMPPRGGTDYSDEDMKKIVKYMINTSMPKKVTIKKKHSPKKRLLKTTYSYVSIYKEPSLESNVVASIKRNSVVRYLKSGGNGLWFKVRTQTGLESDLEGWVEKKRVKKI